MDEGTLLFVPTDEFVVKLRCFMGKYSCNHFDTARAQLLKSFARNKRIRIFNRSDNALDTRVNECVGAWRRFSVMRVRFERNICSSAVSFFAGPLKSNQFGVDDIVVDVR